MKRYVIFIYIVSNKLIVRIWGNNMKKYIIFTCLSILVLGQISANAGLDLNNQKELETTFEVSMNDFTHSVFIEECTATWCPNCPYCAEALYNMYHSEDYDFSFVALVHDVNPNAKIRLDEFTMGMYKGYAFPTTYFDGGIFNIVGRGSTAAQTESMYRDIIEDVGSREVNQPIELNTNVEWLDDAEIRVNIEVTNNGNGLYFGKIRSYITEIESRWNNYDGDPYHYGFLDFAINKIIFLLPGKTQFISVEWGGKEDHNGISFGDITEDNINVISTVSHWKPVMKTGYESNTFTQKYLAFAVDQTHSAIPE